MRVKLDQYLNVSEPITVRVAVDGNAVYDVTCFGVDAAGKLSDDRYMVFYNQPVSPAREISMQTLTNETCFTCALRSLPTTVNKLVFTVSIDGMITMSSLRSCVITVEQQGREPLRLSLTGADFSNERAIVAVEIYLKDVWRMAAIAAGFNGGLSDLLKAYGGEEIQTPAPAPVPNPTPAPTPVPNPAPTPKPIMQDTPPKPVLQDNPAPMSNGPVILTKGKRVNLKKDERVQGDIVINLNWNQKKRGFFSMQSGIDLDLACLYELKDGRKGCIQALGNRFGSLYQPPFIALDGDDRTGANAAGETLRISGAHMSEIRRILVYTFIYEGVANWKQVDGVVTVKCPGSPDFIIHMDEYNTNLPLCCIALFDSTGQNSFGVEKLVQFYTDQEPMDRAHGWGMRWRAGHK